MARHKIKVKYLMDVDPIEVIAQGDWIDLRAAEDVDIKKGEFKLIPLGVAMELPKGFEALIAPRSSTFKRYKIAMANSIGIVDNSYKGENDMWYFPAFAVEDTHIEKNTRICQFRLLKNQTTVEFETVGMLGNDNRGGIGSTGV